MSARDRRAVDYARDRLTAALAVLAKMENHSHYSQEVASYARQLRGALALGDVKIKCECDDCAPGADS